MSVKAEVIFDDSWDEESIVNAFMDNKKFQGIILVRVVPSHCGKPNQKQSNESE